VPENHPRVRSQRDPEGPATAAPRLSLRSRLLLGYLLLLAVFAVVLGAVLIEMRDTQASLTTLSAGYLPLQREISGAESWPLGLELEPGQSPDRLYRVRRTELFVQERMEAQLIQSRDVVAALAAAELDPAESQILDRIGGNISAVLEQLARYRELHAAFITAVEAEEPADIYVPGLIDLHRQIQGNLRDLGRRVSRRVTRVVRRTERSHRDARLAIAALSAVAFLFGLMLVFATSIMLRPVRSLIAGAERFRQGDFDERVEVPRSDELGRLARSFNAMAGSLRERERKLQERTEQLEAALADLRQSQEALIRSERLATIGQMAAQVAHEVRNPLNALGLNAELLKDEVTDGNAIEASELIDAIRDEINRLTRITDAYLALGKAPPMRLEPFPLGELVGDLVRFQREELERSGVAIELDLPADLPDVALDVGQMRQALLNIVKNAGEALSENGGGTLHITAESTASTVTLAVSDDGPGIDAEHVARIFDPFFSTKETGSGLGLPVTQQVIGEHGGRIACRSSLGEGTTFTIELPRA
jgi:two-component system, NtrC family, sensor kinase